MLYNWFNLTFINTNLGQILLKIFNNNDLLLRSVLAFLTALIIGLIIGPILIKYFKYVQGKGQPIRENGPESHLKTKKGTPTMGGFIILKSLIISSFLWADLNNYLIAATIFLLFSYALLGFLDDYLKIAKQNTKGVPGKLKLLWQISTSLIVIFIINDLNLNFLQTAKIIIPFFPDIQNGILYLIFACIVIVGSSNAVNLTDGLDGLATIPIIITSLALAYISYDLLNTNLLLSEIIILLLILSGSALAFLYFNLNPARIFMGDLGSLSIGGMLGLIAIILQKEFIFAIIGLIFVIEAISVILQVYYFKLTKGKRLFLMAPIHHHFEKKGWSEKKVVFCFWTFSCLTAILGVSLYSI